MAASTRNLNDGILLSENTINYSMHLCDADSEPGLLLQALSDVQFHGVDPADARVKLSGDSVFAFDMLADRIVENRKGYKKTCKQNRRNASEQGSAEANESAAAETSAVGGGMLLQDDSLRLLILVAGEDTDLGRFLTALYQIQFTDADPDSVEAALPDLPRILFMMSRNAILANKEACQ